MPYSYDRSGANGRRLTLDERWGAMMSHFKRRPSRRRNKKKTPIQYPEPITPDLLGKWIARSPDGLRIVLSGDTLREVREKAEHLGLDDLAYEHAPKHVRTFIPEAGS